MKQFGEDSVVFATEIPSYEVVSTGSIALDYAIGIGGFPHNRVIEIGGPEGSGKTSLAMITIKNFLERYPDKGAVILDMEHRLTSAWVTSLIGEKHSANVIVVWPDNAEASTDAYTEIACSGAVSVILYDSVGSAPSQRVTGKSATIGNIGGNALPITRLSQFASIYSDKYNVLTIMINQEREDMSGYHQYVTPGGRALKHACSLRIRLRPGKEKFIEEINGEKVQIGYNIRAQVVKNSLAAPYREAYYLFYNVPTEKYGFGIDALEETVRLGVLTGVIEQRGKGWFYHKSLPADSGGENKVHGQAALIEVVRTNDHARSTVVQEIKDKLNSGEGKGVAPSFDPEVDMEVSEEFFNRFESEDDDEVPTQQQEVNHPPVHPSLFS